MMKCGVVIILAASVLISFGQEKKPFEIKGVVKGLPDNTILYLAFPDNDSLPLDSAQVINEQFLFKGTLQTDVAYAIIRTRDFRDYKFLWIEDTTIHFRAQSGKFRSAVITGSKTQDQQNELNNKLDKASEKERPTQERQFVRENPNSIISAHVLSVYSSTWGKDTTASLFNSLSDDLKASTYGRKISEFISLNRNLSVGDKYVDFEQRDTQNKIVRLSDFSNKTVLLEFWGSWCGPCRKANPELVKIYHEFKEQGFEILGVGAETHREVWLKAIEADKLAWPNVTDLQGSDNKAALIYGVSYYPTNFLIDKTGTIVARDLKGASLRKKLKELLEK